MWSALTLYLALLTCAAHENIMPRLRLEDLSDVITTARDFDVAGFGTVR